MGVDAGVAGCPRQVLVLPIGDVLTRPVVPVLLRQPKVNKEHLQTDTTVTGVVNTGRIRIQSKFDRLLRIQIQYEYDRILLVPCTVKCRKLDPLISSHG